MTDEVKEEKSEMALAAGSEKATLFPSASHVPVWRARLEPPDTCWGASCLFTRHHTHTHTPYRYTYTHHTQAQHDGLQSGHRWPFCSVALNSAVIASDDNVINHDIFGRDGRKEQRCLIKAAELEIIHEALKQLNLNSLGPWIKNTSLPWFEKDSLLGHHPKIGRWPRDVNLPSKSVTNMFMWHHRHFGSYFASHKLVMFLLEERNVLWLWNCSRITRVIV